MSKNASGGAGRTGRLRRSPLSAIRNSWTPRAERLFYWDLTELLRHLFRHLRSAFSRIVSLLDECQRKGEQCSTTIDCTQRPLMNC